MRLTRIKTLPVMISGETQPVGFIRDGLLDMQRRRVTYWSVQLSKARRSVLVSASRSALSENSVRLDLSDAALLESGDPAEGLDEDTLATGTLPDVLAANGPDTDGAPLRGVRRVLSLLERAWRPTVPEKPANAPASWVWGSEVTGKPFFTSEGELGRISDIEINERDAALRQLQVSQGGGVTLHINIEAMRHIPEGNSHFVARSAIRRPTVGNDPVPPSRRTEAGGRPEA